MLSSLRWIIEEINAALDDSFPLAMEKVVAPELIKIKAIIITNFSRIDHSKIKKDTVLKVLKSFLSCITFSLYNNIIISSATYQLKDLKNNEVYTKNIKKLE